MTRKQFLWALCLVSFTPAFVAASSKSKGCYYEDYFGDPNPAATCEKVGKDRYLIRRCDNYRCIRVGSVEPDSNPCPKTSRVTPAFPGLYKILSREELKTLIELRGVPPSKSSSFKPEKNLPPKAGRQIASAEFGVEGKFTPR